MPATTHVLIQDHFYALGDWLAATGLQSTTHCIYYILLTSVIIFLIKIFSNTPGRKDPGVKSKNVKNIKAGWNGYVSVSSSSKKVS